jgi:hypothetical protein
MAGSVSRADRGLYRAKELGRDRVEAVAADKADTAAVACAPSIVPLLKADRTSVAA